MDQEYGPNSAQIHRFFSRLETLSMRDLGTAVAVWREKSLDGWHAADDAVSNAIASSRREAERDAITARLYEVFRWAPWYKASQPESLVPGSEASAQYVASVALFALLVRDLIGQRVFQTLYRPFASLIGLDELDAAAGDATVRDVARRMLVEAADTPDAADTLGSPPQSPPRVREERLEYEIRRQLGREDDGRDTSAE
jgi:hypothetical protein